MKKNKIILSSILISTIAVNSFALTEEQKEEKEKQKFEKYSDRKISKLNNYIKRDLSRQDKLYIKIKKMEKKADNYDLNVEAYETAINCIEPAENKNEIEECFNNLKISLKEIKDGVYKSNIEESNSSEDMFYLLGINVHDFDWKKYNFKYITIDMEDTSKEDITELKANGKNVICYISAGSYEDWRSDADKFPKEAIGNQLDDWEGENWLDIRNQEVTEIMYNRMDKAKEKGCDGIDFDNVDGYTNDTGFELTKEDQVQYLINLANYAHDIELKTSLKNGLLMIPDLVTYFDYAINEQCNQYKECNLYDSWLDSGKPVYNIEYKDFEDKDLYKHENFHTYIMDINLKGDKYEKK